MSRGRSITGLNALAERRGSLRGRLILIALIAIVPIVGLAIYDAAQARGQALAEGRATGERLARYTTFSVANRDGTPLCSSALRDYFRRVTETRQPAG